MDRAISSLPGPWAGALATGMPRARPQNKNLKELRLARRSGLACTCLGDEPMVSRAPWTSFNPLLLQVYTLMLADVSMLDRNVQ